MSTTSILRHAATNPTLLRQRSGTASRGSLFDGPKVHASDSNALQKAAQALEQTFVKTLLESSGAFDMGEGAGASFTKDAFLSAIAEVVAGQGGKDGTGLGLMRDMLPHAPTAPRDHAFATRPLPTHGGAKTDLAALLLDGHGRKTSAFGTRIDPFTGATKAHGGVDLGAKEGTQVRAAQTGTVIFAGPRGNYGNAVEIQSQDGTKVLYAHLSAIAVEKGDAITAGAQIGAVGKTGRATGAHLHVEVKHGKVRVDPERFLKNSPQRVETQDEHHRSAGAPSNGGAQ